MEILAELLFGLLGFLFEFLGELIIQVVFEALFELGVHAVRRTRAKKGEPLRTLNPIVAAIGYWVAGIVLGVVSLVVLPTHFIGTFFMRFANLLLMPFAAGCVMSLMGAWRRKRGEELVRIDKFAYGFLFAFGMALVRFLHAQGVIAW